jgi:hypothetical protein
MPVDRAPEIARPVAEDAHAVSADLVGLGDDAVGGSDVAEARGEPVRGPSLAIDPRRESAREERGELCA